jgi:tripeptide aminopeptidase
VAFFAHVDTAPAVSGAGVRPIVHRQYDGRPIVLPDDPTQVLSPQAKPYLASKVGDDIVTASGKTLLGADDKAGVAILMTLAAELLARPDIAHGPVRVCFTTDEEVGYGVRGLALETLGADVGYTLDGGDAGEMTYETFSADKAVVTITGVSTHTGTAKGRMVNALTLAAKFVTLLPQAHLTPETTDGREGFIHLYKIDGSAAAADLFFLLRDFELDGLRAQVALMQAVVDTFGRLEPRARIELTVTPQYRNMRYWLEDNMRPVTLAQQAIRNIGLEPHLRAIRGGTDGSQLTEMGLPTPNLFTGMQDIHSPLEWISLQDMARATAMCMELVQLWAKQT